MAKFGAVFNRKLTTDHEVRPDGYITPSSLTIQTSIVKVQQRMI